MLQFKKKPYFFPIMLIFLYLIFFFLINFVNGRDQTRKPNLSVESSKLERIFTLLTNLISKECLCHPVIVPKNT